MKTPRNVLLTLALTMFASTHLAAMDEPMDLEQPTQQQTMTPEKYRLLKQFAFDNGIPREIVKYIISSNLTPADIFAYVSTLDEDRIEEIFDAEKDKPESIRKMALRLAYAQKFDQELDDNLGCVDFVRDYKCYGVNQVFLLKFTKLFSQAYLPYVLPLLESLIGQPVTELNLTYNRLEELSESIGKLSNLKKLHLSHNELTGLSEWIGSLSNLSSLWLSGNKLTELPKLIGKLSNLEELNLAANQLMVLPGWIANLSNLSRLWLYGNRLTDEEKGKVRQLFVGRSIDVWL